MMSAALIAAMVNCSEPRMQFREFYELQNGIVFPSVKYETVQNVMSRIATSVADYVDYVEAYRDKCGVKK